jgi:uncharacterized ferritin-like protein (DUF455 family)
MLPLGPRGHRGLWRRYVNVTVPDRTERDHRPGGRWSSPHLIDDLLHLAVIERSAAHVIAGWVPKVGELDEKLALAAGLEGHWLRAIALRQHALTLSERDSDALTADPGWIAPLHALDHQGDAPLVIAAISGVRQFLLSRYRELEERLDPMLDARLRATVHSAVDALASPMTPLGTPMPPPSRDTSLRTQLEIARSAGDTHRTPIDDLIWAPIDRVQVPARPAARQRPPTGARAHFRKGSRLTLEDLAGELNDNVMAELSALELLCRCSYEHPDQPWPTHLAIARHATDEARHAAIFRRLLADNGIDERKLPQHGANYEYGYEYPECEPGSSRELVWRLLILSTVLEALAIDKLPVEIAGRDWVGQADFARALDCIAADELFHAENGLRLTRRLCDQLGLNPILERERVHGRFFGRQRDVRTAYLEADPARAAAEIAILEAPDPDGVPYVSRTEVDLRLRCGFTLDECDQVEHWGYNPARHELLDAAREP